MWNDANELEKCGREESFAEMFRLLGDKEAQDKLRADYRNKSHCPWLRKDPNACESLREEIDGFEFGSVCPHNIYASQPEVFTNRDAVIDTVERIFRLVNSAELGVLDPATLDMLTLSELLTARAELDRQQNDRRDRENERSRMESETNKKSTATAAAQDWGHF